LVHWKDKNIHKLLVKLTKRKREKNQVNKIRAENGDIAINANEIQRTIWEYFENLYSNKLESVEEIDKLIDAYDLPTLSQEDISHLNISITGNKIAYYTNLDPSGIDSLPNSTRALRKN
jgi:hypothetical protein